MFVLSPVKHTPHIFCPYAPHIFYPYSPHLLPFRTFARAFARTFARPFARTFARSPVRSLARPLARPLFARSYARPTPLVQYVQKCLKILISDFLNIAKSFSFYLFSSQLIPGAGPGSSPRTPERSAAPSPPGLGKLGRVEPWESKSSEGSLFLIVSDSQWWDVWLPDTVVSYS